MTTEKEEVFRLPAPKFDDETKKSLDSFTKLRNPHFSTPSGMLLPRDKQPPPMYGPRGSTVPPRFLNRRHEQHNRRGGYQQYLREPPRRDSDLSSDLEYDVIPELLQVDWNLWCEGCDVNCETEQEFQAHLEQHRNCKIEGCKYVGHPGVMKRHWRLAHDEKRLQEKAQLATKQTPEVIERWRIERKIRYPTKENIERRRMAQEERFKRGERIEKDKRRFPNRNQPTSGNRPQVHYQRGGKPFHRVLRTPQARKHTTQAKVELVAKEEVRIPFEGTSNLEDYKEKPKSALSLLCGYGSDSEEYSSEEEGELSDSKDNCETAVDQPEDGEISEEQIKAGETVDQHLCSEDARNSPRDVTCVEVSKVEEPLLSEGEIVDSETEIVNPERIHMREDEVEENNLQSGHQQSDVTETVAAEGKKPVPDQNATETKSAHRSRARKRKNRSSQGEPSNSEKPSQIIRVEKPLLDYSKLRYARQNTMLEKLLEPDIRHERNVLMQCVHFVVENRFFGIGQPKQATVEVDNESK